MQFKGQWGPGGIKLLNNKQCISNLLDYAVLKKKR